MLYLFNTTIMPNEGVYVNRKITTEAAKNIIFNENERGNVTSALGHQGSADAFNALIPGLNCYINRIPAVMNAGDKAIALKLNGRMPEGCILTKEYMDEIGYEFYFITNIGSHFQGEMTEIIGDK